jgi:hypothetical protein
MDVHAAPLPPTPSPPAATTSPAGTAPALTDPAPDRLGAEVRESLLLLALCLGVTGGLSAGAQALLALAG